MFSHMPFETNKSKWNGLVVLYTVVLLYPSRTR